jgi:hypothetical protein
MRRRSTPRDTYRNQEVDAVEASVKTADLASIARSDERADEVGGAAEEHAT